MKAKAVSAEVLYPDEPIVKVARADVEWMKQEADRNPRRRIRLCAHRDANDPLHEMLIIHTRETYVRPRKHVKKSESFHVMEGSVNIVLFDDEGSVNEVIRMGDYASGRQFYYRLAEARYHTLVIRSEYLVFHETTNGPFNRADTVFAPWAPEESDLTACKELMQRVARASERFGR